MTTPVQAAFQRSAKRFADTAGIPEEEQMATATKADNKTKTAAGPNAENDMKGSQLQTSQDRGDYGSQSEEVGKQKTETGGAAPEGTPQAGAQNQTAEYKDKNYGLSGSGGAARVATVKTIAAIAGVDPLAAAKFIHLAEGAGDMGTPMGGEPAEVAAGEAAAEGDAAPAEAAPTGPSSDQQAQVKLNDIIKEQDQTMTIDKAVNDKLKEVAKEVGAKIKLPYLGVGTVVAWYKDGSFAAKFASVDATIRLNVKQGAGSMPLAAPAPSVPSAPTSVQTKPKTPSQAGPQPTEMKMEEKPNEQVTDKTVASLKGRKVRHPQFGLGTVTAVKEDKVAITFSNDITVMMPKSALERSDDGGKTKKDEMGNKKVPHTAVDVDDKPQGDGDPDWTLYDQSKESQNTNEGEANNGQQFSESGDRDYRLAAKKLANAQTTLRNQVQALMARGLDVKAATKKVAETKLGQAVMAAVRRKKAIEAARKTGADDASGRTVGGNTPPDEMKSDQADDTTRYESKEQGDTSDDSISDGSDTIFESPETSGVVNDARGLLDKKHNDDTKGSTVAMFSTEERTKALAHLKKMDQTLDGIKSLANKVSPFVVTHQGKGAVVAAVKEVLADLKFQGDIIEASLKTSTGDKRAVRTKLADAVIAGRILMKSARQQAALLGVVAKEADIHRKKFARVSPAFKLAVAQLQSGLVSGDELATKVAEYINLDKTSFEVLAKNVTETIHKMASRPLQRKTATRLPFVGTNGPVSQSQHRDELDGIFDD